MKRTLIVLVVGLLSVGCLTPEQKQKTLRDSVVGEYELKPEDRFTRKLVYLESGIGGYYYNDKKESEYKWTTSNGEIHIEATKKVTWVYRINPDGSITGIAGIFDGERIDRPKESQVTYKKINCIW